MSGVATAPAMAAPTSTGRPRVLVLSREYPNRVAELNGMWVERLVRASARFCEPRVIAPVPYMPPLPGAGYYQQFRAIDQRENVNGIEVLRPRFVIAPGSYFRGTEAASYYARMRGRVDRLRSDFPFELIHAH